MYVILFDELWNDNNNNDKDDNDYDDDDDDDKDYDDDNISLSFTVSSLYITNSDVSIICNRYDYTKS